MSASVLLVFLLARPGLGRRAPAFCAFWRQFPTHDSPCADEKRDANDRRGRECGQVLEHDCGPSTHGMIRRLWRGLTAATWYDWQSPAYQLYRRSSIRVFPRVFGFTRSRSRNSATPSS